MQETLDLVQKLYDERVIDSEMYGRLVDQLDEIEVHDPTVKEKIEGAIDIVDSKITEKKDYAFDCTIAGLISHKNLTNCEISGLEAYKAGLTRALEIMEGR